MATQRLRNIFTHFRTGSTGGGAKEQKTNDASSSAATEPQIPAFDDLPKFKDMPGCAWGVWGPDDQLGTVNLLTEKVVQRAAKQEIVNYDLIELALELPREGFLPMFHRKTPEVKTLIREPTHIRRDDIIHINTQSGTQWDGMRHFGILEHGMYYNNTPSISLPVGVAPIPNPQAIDPAEAKLGIQSMSRVYQNMLVINITPRSLDWADHGICGRGVLLDIVRHQTNGGKDPLPYNPWTTHAITVAELEACAAAQGVTFHSGDILILRVGFIQKYYAVAQEERDSLAARPETFAGIEQSEDMKRFLWNNHFAAIASDQPSLERWPTPEGVPHMHQTLLGLWGMPIGELFDLEKLAAKCAETRRYTFFFSSWPLNIIGGCASPPNAAAYF